MQEGTKKLLVKIDFIRGKIFYKIEQYDWIVNI